MTLTWANSLREFIEKYMLAVYKDRNKIECLELKQNNLSVVSYEVQLVRILN